MSQQQVLINARTPLMLLSGLKVFPTKYFVNFDVENFYPSISIKFSDSVKYVINVIEISDQDVAIIMQARKTLLFQNAEVWVKKSGTEDFDVPMGCYDGAKLCELVPSYMWITKKVFFYIEMMVWEFFKISPNHK